MNALPGMLCLNGLRNLLSQIESGKIVPPFSILLSKGNSGERILVPFRNLSDINVVENQNPTESFAEIKLLVRATDDWAIKVNRDGRGKPIFLTNLDE